MSYSTNSFSEASDAEQAFALWQSKQQETLDENALRKRKAELYALVRKVIKNELDAQQQDIVRLHWYEGKSFGEISEILGIDKSTVARKDKKINDIIFDKLKYAIEYRFGKNFSDISTEIIRTNRAACCPVEGKSISERLKALRLRHGLSPEKLKKLTGIKENRLAEIENNGTQITVQELGKLTGLFNVSSDYIIFGRVPV